MSTVWLRRARAARRILTQMLAGQNELLEELLEGAELQQAVR
ncbi:hypothetical protein ACMATS_36270 [Streptoverticillium reticulum]